MDRKSLPGDLPEWQCEDQISLLDLITELEREAKEETRDADADPDRL